jgi:hypothetical protein
MEADSLSLVVPYRGKAQVPRAEVHLRPPPPLLIKAVSFFSHRDKLLSLFRSISIFRRAVPKEPFFTSEPNEQKRANSFP